MRLQVCKNNTICAVTKAFTKYCVEGSPREIHRIGDINEPFIKSLPF